MPSEQSDGPEPEDVGGESDLQKSAPRLSLTVPLWLNLWLRTACHQMLRSRGYVSMTRFIIEAMMEKLERDFKDLDPREKP